VSGRIVTFLPFSILLPLLEHLTADERWAWFDALPPEQQEAAWAALQREVEEERL
jgi:hypothetical protein